MAVQDPHYPDRHRRAVYGVVGTEAAGPTVGAVEDALASEGHDVVVVGVG